MNHYPRHVGDYLRDTVGLTMLEDGAYTRLLDQYYSRGGPLPADSAVIYRMARAHSRHEKAAVDSVLRQFFVLKGGVFCNKRCDLELSEQALRSASARESAKQKWLKKHMQDDANAHANAMRTQCDGNAESMLASNQKPVTSNQRDIKHPRKRVELTEPTAAHQAQADASGVACKVEFDKYRDWLLTKNVDHKDQGAGFRNWLRQAADFKAKAEAKERARPKSVHESRAAVMAEIFKEKGSERSNERGDNVIDITCESQRVA